MLIVTKGQTKRLLSGLVTTLISLGILMVIPSCGPKTNSHDPEAYIENGVQWAYGSVDVTYLDVPGNVTLQRSAGVQGVDTYGLYGSILAATNGGSGKREVAYVDYHPNKSKLLAFAYNLSFRKRAGRQDTVDVYVQLYKSGRSKRGQKSVFIGTANFQQGNALATLNLAQGLYLSLIASGVYEGQWSVHFPNARKKISIPWQGLCSSRVSQMPGQNPSQNPSQNLNCRPVPAQIDLCGGKPNSEGCRPKPPQNPVSFGDTENTTTLDPVEEVEDVFTIPETSTEGKFTFVSKHIDADEQNNSELCSQKFLAVARTVGEQVNAACIMKPAPASPINGKLRCAITVSFNAPRTYLERVCNITAMFKGPELETQKVQVLDQ